MEIKFITQLLRFLEFAHHNKFPSSVRMLWIGIFLCANKLAQRTGKRNIWPMGYFPASNAEINIFTGLDERTIRKDRERLRMYRLIEYTRGDGKKLDPSYKINYLKMNGYKIVPDCIPDSIPDNSTDNAADDVHDYDGDNSSIGSKNVPDTVGGFSPDINNSKLPRSPDSEEYTDTPSEAAARSTYSPSTKGFVDLNRMPIRIKGLVPTATLRKGKD